MKIALFHNLPAGGAKRALFEHTHRLAARGHTLDAYVLSSANEAFLPLAPLCDHVFVYDAPASLQGKNERATAHPALRLLKKGLGGRVAGKLESYHAVCQRHRDLAALESVYAQVGREIDKRGYDLVYAHNCRFLSSPFLLRHLQTPSVFYCQDTLRYVHEWALETHPEFDLPSRSWGREKVRGHVVAFYVARLWEAEQRLDAANARAATMVLANSWYSREAILRHYGINARVCYLGVDSQFFSPDTTVERENTVLSVGSIARPKRHDFIVQAIARIPQARRPRMHLIGHPASSAYQEGPAALRSLADELGVHLKISEEVSDASLRDGYRRAAVVAVAAHLEPFGFVPLEAMACGVPTVAVSEAGLRESVQNGVTGLLTGRDPQEFGDALDQLLTDETRAAEMGANGRVAAECIWTWERSVDRLETCFQQVLETAQ